MKRNILVTLVLAAVAAVAAACYVADDSLHAPAQTQDPAAKGLHRTLHDTEAEPAPQAKRGWWNLTFYGRWPSQT